MDRNFFDRIEIEFSRNANDDVIWYLRVGRPVIFVCLTCTSKLLQKSWEIDGGGI